MHWLAPAIAALLAAALAARCIRQSRGRGSVALGVWGVALAQYAVASGALAVGAGAGWSAGLYRVYYLFGAVLNVVWLGLGTIWLLAPGLIAKLAAVAAAAASVVAAVVTATVRMQPTAETALRDEVLPAGIAVMPALPRLLATSFSIAGSAVVLGGLLWSLAVRRGRASGLALLTVGVVAVVAASRFARTGRVTPFSVGLAAGVALMYAGFVRTR